MLTALFDDEIDLHSACHDLIRPLRVLEIRPLRGEEDRLHETCAPRLACLSIRYFLQGWRRAHALCQLCSRRRGLLVVLQQIAVLVMDDLILANDAVALSLVLLEIVAPLEMSHHHLYLTAGDDHLVSVENIGCFGTQITQNAQIFAPLFL